MLFLATLITLLIPAQHRELHLSARSDRMSATLGPTGLNINYSPGLRGYFLLFSALSAQKPPVLPPVSHIIDKNGQKGANHQDSLF